MTSCELLVKVFEGHENVGEVDEETARRLQHVLMRSRLDASSDLLHNSILAQILTTKHIHKNRI